MILKASAIPPGQRLLKKRAAVALAQADEIVRMAEEDRARVAAEAYERGYEEGLRRWNQAVLDAQSAEAKRVEAAEPEFVRLALGIARKIVGQELRLSPDAVATIVKSAIANLRLSDKLHIQVHPEAMSHVEAGIAGIQQAAGGSCQIVVSPNEEIEPGGCVVSSGFGSVDARLETQLRVLERVLLGK